MLHLWGIGCRTLVRLVCTCSQERICCHWLRLIILLKRLLPCSRTKFLISSVFASYHFPCPLCYVTTKTVFWLKFIKNINNVKHNRVLISPPPYNTPLFPACLSILVPDICYCIMKWNPTICSLTIICSSKQLSFKIFASLKLSTSDVIFWCILLVVLTFLFVNFHVFVYVRLLFRIHSLHHCGSLLKCNRWYHKTTGDIFL